MQVELSKQEVEFGKSGVLQGKVRDAEYLVPSRFIPSCVTPEMAHCLGTRMNHNVNQSMMGRPAVAWQCLFSHGLPLPLLLPTGILILQFYILLYSGVRWIPVAGSKEHSGSEGRSACVRLSDKPHS